MKQRRKVWAITDKTPGKTVTFPITKDSYTPQENGSVVNANPKPYRGKAEMKRYKRQRQGKRILERLRKEEDEA